MKHLSDRERTEYPWLKAMVKYQRICPMCKCVDDFGTCHCDYDIYDTECFKKGRHEEGTLP